MTKFSRAIKIAVLVAALSSGALNAAFADCTPGASRCGADGYVERCNYDGSRWDANMITRCEGSGRGGEGHYSGNSGRGSECVPGASRCGADGYVERCSFNGMRWESSVAQCR